MEAEELDEYMDNRIVWLNKEDMVDRYNLFKKILDIHCKRMVYGECFILTKDLTKEILERIFNGRD